MREKRIFVLMVLAIISVALVCNFSGPAQAGPKVVKIRMPSQMPVGHYNTVALDNFIKDAETRSGGTLKITHFPAGQLYKPEDLVDVLPDGGVEMAQIAIDRHLGRVPAGHFASSPLMAHDWYLRTYYDVAQGGGLFYNIIRPAFRKDNIHVLSTLMNAADFAIITNKPVKKVGDYKGLKIRASGKGLGAAVESWGASAVVMSSADVYMAIQRGTIDGAMSGATSLVSRKWFEIADYVQDMDIGVFGFSLAANLKFWNSLTDKQRKAIEEAARATEIWLVDRALKGEVEALDTMKKAGVKIYNWPPEQHKKLVALSTEGIAKVTIPDIGEDVWKEAMRYVNAAAKSTTPWKQLLQKRKM